MANGINRWTCGYKESRETEEADTFGRRRLAITRYYLESPITKQFTTDPSKAYFFPDYQSARTWPRRAMIRAEAVKVWQWFKRGEYA